MINFQNTAASLSGLFTGIAVCGALSVPIIDPVRDAYYEGSYTENVAYSDMTVQIPYCLTDRESFEFSQNSRNLPAGEEWIDRYDASMNILIRQVTDRNPRCAGVASESSAENKARAFSL